MSPICGCYSTFPLLDVSSNLAVTQCFLYRAFFPSYVHSCFRAVRRRLLSKPAKADIQLWYPIVESSYQYMAVTKWHILTRRCDRRKGVAWHSGHRFYCSRLIVGASSGSWPGANWPDAWPRAYAQWYLLKLESKWWCGRHSFFVNCNNGLQSTARAWLKSRSAKVKTINFLWFIWCLFSGWQHFTDFSFYVFCFVTGAVIVTLYHPLFARHAEGGSRTFYSFHKRLGGAFVYTKPLASASNLESYSICLKTVDSCIASGGVILHFMILI
jgi:hypothetical protein